MRLLLALLRWLSRPPRHDGAGQPGYVTRLCHQGRDGCEDPACACCCHDEPTTG